MVKVVGIYDQGDHVREVVIFEGSPLEPGYEQFQTQEMTRALKIGIIKAEDDIKVFYPPFRLLRIEERHNA